MGLVVVRVGAALFFVGLFWFGVRERKRLAPWLRSYFLAPTSPVTIGLFRIVLFALLWNGVRGAHPEWFAAFPPDLRAPPFGWDLVGDLPFHAGAAVSARRLLLATSIAATLGLFTRVTVPISALLAVYVLGLPQCFGKVTHGGHARMLCALALALSPCGDALSLDALIRRLRGHAAPPPSSAYTLPVRVAWLLVGTTYLFPGLWKLLESGDLWFSGRQLLSELHRRWSVTPDFQPWFRVDRHPWALALLGTATIALEIGFVFAMFERRARVLAACSAVGFHLGVAAVMGIRFPPYVPLLVLVEVPENVLMTVRARLVKWKTFAWVVERSPFPARRVTTSAILLGILLFGQVAAGVTKTSSWPISVYPTFSARKVGRVKQGSGMRIVVETTGGAVHDLAPILKKSRVPSVSHVMKRLVARATEDRPRFDGREVVSLFEYLGIALEAGDQVVFLESSWDLFPLGEQARFREEETHRFEVQNDLGLSAIDVQQRQERELTARADVSTPPAGQSQN
jgi:hypothetical protein